jgi:transposase-like protein
MNRILRTITTLGQHFDEIANGGDCYRPVNCPHCQATGLWHHGCYHRKADRSEARRNPVAILRFFCKACLRTCSRLPTCIAPRRWYDWATQQVVLLLLLASVSLHQGCRQTGCARSTLRRWRDWLQTRGAQFSFFLRSRLPELGRLPEPDFWPQVISSLSLARVMTELDQDLVVP